MQKLRADSYSNKGEWAVHPVAGTNMFEVRSSKGHRLPSMYTERKVAENELRAYLERQSRPPKPVGRPKVTTNAKEE